MVDKCHMNQLAIEPDSQFQKRYIVCLRINNILLNRLSIHFYLTHTPHNQVSMTANRLLLRDNNLYCISRIGCLMNTKHISWTLCTAHQLNYIHQYTRWLSYLQCNLNQHRNILLWVMSRLCKYSLKLNNTLVYNSSILTRNSQLCNKHNLELFLSNCDNFLLDLDLQLNHISSILVCYLSPAHS